MPTALEMMVAARRAVEAGFNPNQPRDQFGRWLKGGIKDHHWGDESGGGPRAAKKSSGKKAKASLSDVAKGLQSAKGKEAAGKYLDDQKLTAAELRQLADDMGITLQKRATKQQIRDTIIDGLDGMTFEGVTPEYVRNELKGMRSRQQATEFIDGLKMTAPELRKLAADLGVHVGSKATKTQIRDEIVNVKVGRRLASDAISKPSTRHYSDRPAKSAVSSASAPAVTKPLSTNDLRRQTGTSDMVSAAAANSLDWADRQLRTGKDPSDVADELRRLADRIVEEGIGDGEVTDRRERTRAELRSAAKADARGLHRIADALEKAASPKPGTGTVAALGQATSRAEARSMLANLTAAQLRDLFPADLTVRGNKTELIDALVELYVGNRLNSAAIRKL